MLPIIRDSDQENTVVRTPPVRAQRGESSVAYGPIFWSCGLSVPAFPGSFDSGDPRCTSQTVPRM